GADSHIVLYSFGGLAIGSNALSSRWKRIAVAFAGPLAGFLFYGLLWVGGYFRLFEGWPIHAVMAVVFLKNINLYWGLINLLPVWPLDGGQISRELFVWGTPGKGVRASLAISVTVGALVAVDAAAGYNDATFIPYILPTGGWYCGGLFALLAFSNYQE